MFVSQTLGVSYFGGAFSLCLPVTISAHTSSLPSSLCLKAVIVFGESLGQGGCSFLKSLDIGTWQLLRIQLSISLSVGTRGKAEPRDKGSLSPEASQAWLWPGEALQPSLWGGEVELSILCWSEVRILKSFTCW